MCTVYAVSHHMPDHRPAFFGKLAKRLASTVCWSSLQCMDTVVLAQYILVQHRPEGYRLHWCTDLSFLQSLSLSLSLTWGRVCVWFGGGT